MRRQFAAASALSALAQASVFIKLWLSARIFGVGAEIDGYFLALLIPTFVSGVLSGILQTALFPVRERLAVNSERETVHRFERGVIAALVVIGMLVAATIMTAGGQAIRFFAPQAAPSVIDAALFVLPFALALIPLNLVGDGMSYLLALRQRYPIAAAAPIANALLGAGLLLLWPEGGLLNLAIGTVAGLTLQLAICWTALHISGFSITGRLPIQPEIKRDWGLMLRLSAWIFPGVIFSNMTATLPLVLMSSHGEGAVSAFGYAWRFHQVAIQLLIMAASPVLLAHFSRLIANGDEVVVRALLRKSVLLSGLVGVVAFGSVLIFGKSVLSVVFGGRFDSQAASQVADQWLVLTLGLAAALLGSVLAKVWQARGQAALMSLLAGLGLVVFLAFEWILASVIGEYSVAAALGLSSLSVVLVGWLISHVLQVRAGDIRRIDSSLDL